MKFLVLRSIALFGALFGALLGPLAHADSTLTCVSQKDGSTATLEFNDHQARFLNLDFLNMLPVDANDPYRSFNHLGNGKDDTFRNLLVPAETFLHNKAGSVSLYVDNFDDSTTTLLEFNCQPR